MHIVPFMRDFYYSYFFHNVMLKQQFPLASLAPLNDVAFTAADDNMR